MKNKLETKSRILLALSGMLLIVVLFVPLWTIDLIAPQYPEGLVLVIYPNGLGGNVDIINGLNHYIGMKELHNEDFAEFKILPYIICIFAALFISAAIIGRRRFMHGLLAAYILFGVVAMIDFYRWEYQYGHDLDPNAAIQVPGMAYQPPLIGYKQLLNFSAYSMPDVGGWLFMSAGLLAIIATVLEYRSRKKAHTRPLPYTATPMAALLILFTLSSCNTEPEAIQFGRDQCYSCKMSISDDRYGAAILSKKGRTYKFDDSYCAVEFLQSGALAKDQLKNVYLVDFAGQGQLIPAEAAFLFKTNEIRSPMGGNIIALKTETDRHQLAGKYQGTMLTWKELVK